MGYQLTQASENKKTGAMPVSISDSSTCPKSCPLLKNGCYARNFPLGYHWRRVDSGGLTWAGLLAKVKKIPRGNIWRHNQAGDLPGVGDRLDVAALRELVKANGSRRGFTYSHKPLRRKIERQAVKDANAAGFVVNLSADNLAEADKLAALGVGPVVVVLPRGSEGGLTPGGRRVVRCLAEGAQAGTVTCASCQLCADAGRKTVIGFTAHGNRWKLADKIAKGVK